MWWAKCMYTWVRFLFCTHPGRFLGFSARKLTLKTVSWLMTGFMIRVIILHNLPLPFCARIPSHTSWTIAHVKSIPQCIETEFTMNIGTISNNILSSAFFHWELLKLHCGILNQSISQSIICENKQASVVCLLKFFLNKTVQNVKKRCTNWWCTHL